MSLMMLKIRIKGNTTELCAARALERAEVDRAWGLRMRTRLNKANIPDKKIERILRRAIFGRAKKNPAEDAAQIWPTPDPEWIAQADANARDLREDRTTVLRREARVHHLVYGFLRGVPYKAMERMSYEPPPWQTKAVLLGERRCPVEMTVLAYGLDSDPRDLAQRLAQWKDEAGVWQHPNGTKRRDWAKERERQAMDSNERKEQRR